jgi:hypothetical protein
MVKSLEEAWGHNIKLYFTRFNEKVFVFFWFWFLFVGILSILGLFYWSTASILPSCKRAFITKYLRCMGAIEPISSAFEMHLVNSFIDFLRTDGIFLLRMIQAIFKKFFKISWKRPNLN